MADRKSSVTLREGKLCVLCGWPSSAYLVFPVPLSSPKQERVVCLDCADDIRDRLVDLEESDGG